MVANENIRKAFSERLHSACDKAGVRVRGRAVDIQAELKRRGIIATTTAIGKWLNGESVPNSEKLRPLALWLGVRAAWLEYNEQPMHAEESQHGTEEMLPGNTGNESNVAQGSRHPAADNHKEIAAAKVLEMLQKHGKGLSAAAQQQIANAVADSLREQEPETSQPSNVIIADFLPPAPASDAIRIAHYDVRTALGSGQLVPDYPEIMPDLLVSKQHLQELGVIYKDPAHLKMLTGYGQSMAPTIQHLDPMIVDASIREFEGDGIYSFVWQGHFYTKRLQVADAEHFEMISDNPNHKDRLIRIDDTYIQARVLLVWNAKKL